MLCTPILSRTLATVPQAMHQAAAQADWIEWRLDFLEDFDFGNPVPQVAPVLAHSPRPVILTFRPQEQGGARPLSLRERWAFWRHASQLEAARFDFEADLVNWALQENQPLPPWEKIIVSHHDFEQTPEDLPGLVGQTFPAPVQTFKLATKASNTSDLLRLFQLLEGTSRQPIVIGMGMPGAATRILGPAYGSLVTFTTAADGAPSAPGQFSARALREVFHLPALNRETTVTGLIGCPVGHSLSPHIHNAAFAQLGINGVYVPFEVQPDGQDLPAFVRNFVHPRTRCCGWPLRGLSVTIPHKVSVVPLCDRLTETAQGVGAVNTLLVEDGQLIGHNTDVAGGMEPLEKKFGSLKGVRVAVLGAGGAALAILYGLAQRGAQVTLFARNPVAAQSVAARFEVPVKPLDAFSGSGFDGLVNTTPVGMKSGVQGSGFRVQGSTNELPNSQSSVLSPQSSVLFPNGEMPISGESLRGLQWVYDLIYTPRPTPLLHTAHTYTIATLDGLDMLLSQAALQFEFWTRCSPPLEVMRNAAEQVLSSEFRL